MLLRLRDQRGQTSAEYLGVIVLIGLILAGLLTAGPGVGDMIASGLERAICAVRNEACGGAPAGAALGGEAGDVPGSSGEDGGDDGDDGGAGLGHALLDGCGLVPVFGEACDVANGVWYAAEGDYVNAGLSAGSAVPFLGYGATAIKAGRRGAEVLDAANKAGKGRKGKPGGGGKGKPKFNRGGPGPNFPDEALDDPDFYEDLAGAGKTVTRANAADILANNMKRMGLEQPPGTTAHHIIPFEAGAKGTNAAMRAAARARQLFDRWGIDINSAANGVYLDRPFHRALHSRKYYEELERRLQAATSRDDAISILHDIREDLIKGTFPPQ